MKETPNIQTWHFDIILCDGFVLSELSAITDTLRICNRTLAHKAFSWSFHSDGGGIRRNPCGVMVETQDIPQKPDAQFLFVLGNADPDAPGLSLRPMLSRYFYAGTRTYLLAEAAARFIHEDGSAGHMTTHWENSTLLRERHGYFEAGTQFVCDAGQVVTCAGLEATVDVVLALIGKLISTAAQTTVANILLHDTVRDPGTLQPVNGGAIAHTGDRDLDHCIRLMQENIEDPLPISTLVDDLGISPRSLERRFKTRLGVSPNTFYRKIRMHRANNLLLNTSMCVRDVGLACGFPNGFSTLYKSFFGVTPAALRKARRREIAAG